jgi:hypothetical protein
MSDNNNYLQPEDFEGENDVTIYCVKWNHAAGFGRCAAGCGKAMELQIGWNIFRDLTWDRLCDACAAELAPGELMLVKMASMAELYTSHRPYDPISAQALAREQIAEETVDTYRVGTQPVLHETGSGSLN